MSYTETKVIEMDKGKKVGDPLIQGAYSVPYDNNNSVGDELDRINEHLSDIKEIIYPIGCIIESTTCSSLALVKQTYGGNNWIQHTGYMLRGATSGVTADQAQKDGGEDTHTLTESEMPPHAHTASSSAVTSVTVNTGYISGSNYNFAKTNESWLNYGLVFADGGNRAGIYGTSSVGNMQISDNTGHAHTASALTSVSTTVNSAGSGGAHNNVPNYKNVYIWERVS